MRLTKTLQVTIALVGVLALAAVLLRGPLPVSIGRAAGERAARMTVATPRLFGSHVAYYSPTIGIFPIVQSLFTQPSSSPAPRSYAYLLALSNHKTGECSA